MAEGEVKQEDAKQETAIGEVQINKEAFEEGGLGKKPIKQEEQ